MTETGDNNANAPLIDIIIPVYNGERFVCEAIDSVCKQTHQNVRIIVVNDGSTDGSREKILALAGQLPNLVFIDRPHCGVSAKPQVLISGPGGATGYHEPTHNILKG